MRHRATFQPPDREGRRAQLLFVLGVSAAAVLAAVVMLYGPLAVPS